MLLGVVSFCCPPPFSVHHNKHVGVPTSGGESFLKLVMLLLVHMGMTVWVGVSPMSVGPLTPSTYFLGRGRWSTVRKCQLMRQITSVGIC